MLSKALLSRLNEYMPREARACNRRRHRVSNRITPAVHRRAGTWGHFHGNLDDLKSSKTSGHDQLGVKIVEWGIDEHSNDAIVKQLEPACRVMHVHAQRAGN